MVYPKSRPAWPSHKRNSWGHATPGGSKGFPTKVMRLRTARDLLVDGKSKDNDSAIAPMDGVFSAPSGGLSGSCHRQPARTLPDLRPLSGGALPHAAGAGDLLFYANPL